MVVGLVEELFKLLPFPFVMRFSDFNDEIDGIFYASACALGFASYENVHYLPGLAGFALFGRAFASPLSHSVFASVWGHLAGVAHIRKKKLLPPVLKGLGLAALLHGLFDFLNLAPLLRFFSALLILAVWLWRIRTSERRAIKNHWGLRVQLVQQDCFFKSRWRIRLARFRSAKPDHYSLSLRSATGILPLEMQGADGERYVDALGLVALVQALDEFVL